MLPFTELSKEEQTKFFDSIDLILVDCDGVLWHGKPLPGSGDTIDSLVNAGKRVVLVSNNATMYMHQFKDKIKNANVQKLKEVDIITPAISFVEYLKGVNYKRKLYTLCSAGSIDWLRKAGFECDDGSDLNTNSSEDIVKQVILDPDVGAVIIDSDTTISYMKLSKAAHYLRRGDTLFLAGAMDYWYPIKPDITLFAFGGFVDLLQRTCKREPIILGKPGEVLGTMLAQKYSITNPKRVLFIGDTLEQDITFAYKQGYRSMLVLSGYEKMESAEAGFEVEMVDSVTKRRYKEKIKSEFYIKTLSDLKSILKRIGYK